MSPLARSLLALVALIVDADAIVKVFPPMPGGECDGFQMDIKAYQSMPTTKKLTFEFKESGDGQLHNITNHCESEGKFIKSQIVKVCNDFHDEVALAFPPKVKALDCEKLSPVYAACDPWVEANLECGLLRFHITQECTRVNPCTKNDQTTCKN